MGSGGTYGAGVGGGVNFIGSMMVCPVDWNWSTSQSFSSSSTSGHTRDGAAMSSAGVPASSAAGGRSPAEAEARGAVGSALAGRPAGSGSEEGVFRIAARVFTLIPSWPSVKAHGTGLPGPARSLHD